LTLANGENVKPKEDFRLVFEASEMRNGNPRLVGECGIVMVEKEGEEEVVRWAMGK
jgi:hypothetical protein